MLFRTAIFLILFSQLIPAELIRLKSRVIDAAHEPWANLTAPGKRLTAGRRHLMLAFGQPLTREFLAGLALRGAVVTSPVSANAVMVSLEDAVSPADLSAVWAGELRSADKISRLIRGNHSHFPAWIVEFHRDVPAQTAREIASRSGFELLPAAALLPNQVIVRANPRLLPALAEWDEVAYIFPASSDILTDRRIRPCSGGVIAGEDVAQYVTVGNGWPANSPAGATVNYVFTTLTSDAPNAVEGAILQAMHQWSAIANVQFVEGSDAAAPYTIAIEFGTSVNDDPTPFDAAGTILAHTYYPAPPNPEPIAGDMHFNPAVAWRVGATTDVYTVALHELGHALGLGHTDNPSDVMYPYYRFGATLSADDIAGVQSLYGAKGGAIPSANTNSGGALSTPMASAQPLGIVVTSPSNGFVTASSTVDLSGSSSGPGNVNISWRSSTGASGTATAGALWSASSVPLSAGLNLITLVASGGGQTASTLVRVVRVNSSQNSPSAGSASSGNASGVFITSPQNDSTATADQVSISGTADDPQGISQVTWLTNSGASGAATGTTRWIASGVPLFSGANVIVIRAVNNAGEIIWNSITINYE